eukprot:scaffold19185_cov47-Cyclotella_meneghiniana.AAC.1
MEGTCALLYGGFTESTELADQLCHCDIPGLSTCKKFDSLCKPFAAIIPLSQDGRELYFVGSLMKKNRVNVNFGEAILFFGDTPHGGITYAKSEKQQPPLYTSLHLIINLKVYKH